MIPSERSLAIPEKEFSSEDSGVIFIMRHAQQELLGKDPPLSPNAFQQIDQAREIIAERCGRSSASTTLSIKHSHTFRTYLSGLRLHKSLQESSETDPRMANVFLLPIEPSLLFSVVGPLTYWVNEGLSGPDAYRKWATMDYPTLTDIGIKPPIEVGIPLVRDLLEETYEIRKSKQRQIRIKITHDTGVGGIEQVIFGKISDHIGHMSPLIGTIFPNRVFFEFPEKQAIKTTFT